MLRSQPANMIASHQRAKEAQNSFQRYHRLGTIEDLDKAIHFQRQAISLAPHTHPDKPRHLGLLGSFHLERLRRLGEILDVNRAINSYAQAISLIHSQHIDMPSLLYGLGVAYFHRFERMGGIQNIDQALRCQSLSLSLPGSQAYLPLRLIRLGYMFRLRFYIKRNVSDLHQAIHLYGLAVSAIPDSSPQKPKILTDLGTMHLHQFDQIGSTSDVQSGIDYYHAAIRLTPLSDVGLPRKLNRLGTLYQRRFEFIGQLADIDKALDLHSQALSHIPDGHVSQSGFLRDLGVAYGRRFERLGRIEDIYEAISWLTSAVSLISENDPRKSLTLSHLGSVWMRLFHRTGNTANIDEAINLQTTAISLAFNSSMDMPGYLNELGLSYTSRFDRLGDPSDIHNALECLNKATSLTPDGHPEQPNFLNNLANMYYRRFDHLGDVEDIDQAISWQSLTVLLTPDDHANKPLKIGNLGNMFQSRFNQLGKISDIDEAIELQSRAFSLFPEVHAEKPRLFKRLGNSYLRRFERLEDPTDIDKAIHFHSSALSLTPDDDVDKSDQLNCLGIAYSCRFQRQGRREDIDEAIIWLDIAVQLTPDDHVNKPMMLTNLGSSYSRRFALSQEPADINNAIDCGEQAVLLVPENHADKRRWLTNLGIAYMSRFEHLGQSGDGDQSIARHKLATLLTPDDDFNKPTVLTNLGLPYLSRFQRSSAPQDIENAVSCFQEAALSATGHPRSRFHASLIWARSLSKLLGDSSSVQAFQRAMELVPQLVWLGSTITQRYRLITEMGQVATEAAACAIGLGALDRAIEWLEEGRSIVWNQILKLRTPFDKLSTVDFVLAKQLEEVGQELEQAGSRVSLMSPSLLADRDSSSDNDARRHHHLASEWDRLIQEARRIPGFENFLLPRKASELRAAAKDGPVVLINTHSTRCDALVLQPDSNKIAHVPLSRFSHDKAMEIRTHIGPLIGRQGINTDTRHLKRLQTQLKHSFVNILEVLWADVVEPIFQFLGYTHKPPTDKLPHITWCTTGALSFLPLHAAGCYNGLQPDAFDLVVSSYTPTVGALLAPAPQVVDIHPRVLAVGQENTKGLTQLPCTRLELAAIKEYSEITRYLQLEDRHATVSAVLDGMAEYDWVHLACHAIQQTDDPSQSAFHLHDGGLTLSMIAERSFKNKGLAFLSACQTATGSKALPDEAVHLAAGMLMAGYPSVIATMWSIQDEDAPVVARDVYRDLLNAGGAGASRALHGAIGNLREKVGETSFERWVPFVHIGI